jgi:hypothetical protein
MKKYIFLMASLLIFSSCEKVIELDLESVEPMLVIEGNITNQPGPYTIKLTKTVEFDQPSNYPGISNALVIIKDNTGIVDTLKYTQNGDYITQKTQGIESRIYDLSVVSEGKTYTSTSRMPIKINLDTLQVNTFKFGGQEQNVIVPTYRDGASIGNNYNFRLTVNDTLDKTYIVWNDNVNNGEPNRRPLRSETRDLSSGDAVSLEMQCIDINVYNYYFTLLQIAGNGPGGGTTPTNPPNNITGGALGIFSAHTTQVKKIVIP